ncbi:MAG: regulatory iron-sulfur-containing complex subunit RicT, partial [Lentisphaeria bacterium]
LRQVGVRDQTAVVGGIGTCGRSFCCSTFLNHFESINVRTAKDQGMPLNPTTISGACGRLKCCLKYEHDGYVEMQKIMPKIGSIFKTADGDGKVVDVNCLKGIVKVKTFSDNPKIIDVDINADGNKNEPPTKKCGTCSPKGCTGKCHKQKRNKDN